jgi:hypothetical protein
MGRLVSPRDGDDYNCMIHDYCYAANCLGLANNFIATIWGVSMCLLLRFARGRRDGDVDGDDFAECVEFGFNLGVVAYDDDG